MMDSNRSDDIVLNLNDAFNKKSDFVFVNNRTTDKTEINSFLDAENSENMINNCSLLNQPSRLIDINSQLSVIQTDIFSQNKTDSNLPSSTQGTLLNNKTLASATVIDETDIHVRNVYDLEYKYIWH